VRQRLILISTNNLTCLTFNIVSWIQLASATDGLIPGTWDQPNSINTRGNTCTTCHRIGSQHTCSSGILETFEPEKTSSLDDWGKQYPHSHWMPPDNYRSEQAWKIIYRQSINDLSDCCKNPSLAKCIVEPVPAAVP
jgi:hypothetical protein